MKVSLEKLCQVLIDVRNMVPDAIRKENVDITLLDESIDESIGNVLTIKCEYDGRNNRNKAVKEIIVVEIFPDGDRLPSRMTKTSIADI